jgi:hypothetical protein
MFMNMSKIIHSKNVMKYIEVWEMFIIYVLFKESVPAVFKKFFQLVTLMGQQENKMKRKFRKE